FCVPRGGQPPQLARQRSRPSSMPWGRVWTTSVPTNPRRSGTGFLCWIISRNKTLKKFVGAICYDPGQDQRRGTIFMNRKLFGTDGIRGLANSHPMTPEIAMRAGMAAARLFTHGDQLHRVVIGKDTRLSGYMIESALVAGFTALGMDVFLFGPLPTPAIAMLTRSLRADLGVMISASPNSFEANGIQFFGPDGLKLSDERETEIEELMAKGFAEGLAKPRKIGRAKRIDDSQARYIEYAKRTFPKNLTLDGMRIVVDCANGAAY